MTLGIGVCRTIKGDESTPSRSRKNSSKGSALIQVLLSKLFSKISVQCYELMLIARLNIKSLTVVTNCKIL